MDAVGDLAVCLPGSSEQSIEGWELGCTIKMTSAYKLVFGILGEHYLANSFFLGGGVVLDDVVQIVYKQLFVNVFPN